MGRVLLHRELFAKVFRSWFDKLTMNGISRCYKHPSVRPELVEGQNVAFA
jgi:hypothetical protein